MKLIVSGASGFIGQGLIPLLQEKGFELCLLGRDKRVLFEQYPDCQSEDYASLNTLTGEWDGFIHLALSLIHI